MKRTLITLLLAAPLLAGAMEPPDDAEMQRQREKAELWASRALTCDQVLANLRGWFGRLFVGETNPANGTCDVYVVTWQWRRETGRDELIHRQRIATIPL